MLSNVNVGLKFWSGYTCAQTTDPRRTFLKGGRAVGTARALSRNCARNLKLLVHLLSGSCQGRQPGLPQMLGGLVLERWSRHPAVSLREAA